MSVRVLLAEDYPAVRDALEVLLSRQELITVAGVLSLEEAIHWLEQKDEPVDVITLGIAPRKDRAEAVRQIRAIRPDVRLVGLYLSAGHREIYEMLSVDAVVDKALGPEEIVAEILAVSRRPPTVED
jgi:DNA-binding NarL/FixJ family response regulator